MMRKVALPAMRTDYNEQIFDDTCFAAKEPIMQFDAWFKEATAAEGIAEANLMVLTTCGRECRPRARIVYLRGYDETGFRFHTNYTSLKGQQLNENPYACLLFFWEALHRQVTIEGKVEKLTEKENEKHFHSSPRYHQIADLVSFNQSSVISSREVLDDKEAKLKEEYADTEKVIPKPYYGGGFKVVPHQVEFGRDDQTDFMTALFFVNLETMKL